MVIDLTNTGQSHKLNLRCNGIILQQLDCFKYLGIVIDNQLKWERHITEVTKRISFNNARLRMLRNILPRDVLIKIFNATSIPIIGEIAMIGCDRSSAHRRFVTIIIIDICDFTNHRRNFTDSHQAHSRER